MIDLQTDRVSTGEFDRIDDAGDAAVIDSLGSFDEHGSLDLVSCGTVRVLGECLGNISVCNPLVEYIS